jgi:hypothetical protein
MAACTVPVAERSQASAKIAQRVIECGIKRLDDAVATQGHDDQLAECSLRQADRYRPREFGIHESDGAPDEKESRPKHEPPGYQACMMAQ